MSNVFVWSFWCVVAAAALRLTFTETTPWRWVGVVLLVYLIGIALVLWIGGYGRR